MKKILGSIMMVLSGIIFGMTYMGLYPEEHSKKIWYINIAIGVLILIQAIILISEAPLVVEVKPQGTEADEDVDLIEIIKTGTDEK